ncbi:hypothetical protein HS1_002083 [Candidatus Desulfofervidus auxilii]|uniref:Uncharacterized protein n=1 Tax=Desulfofervidus auxilii TaxID=1621989 RepID=A0A7U4QM66_DESA2|nr:hypothetical protein [Candidatus Desulfofervidus auxilii]AMM41871.1 hypothetical protein HS1_002083 [Candidatus Desulfofervidus auxilii]
MQYKSNFTIWYRNCSISEVDENLNEQLGNKFCDQRRKNTIKMICEDNANQTAKAVTAYLKLDECKVLAEFAKKKLGLKGAILVANDDLGRLGANFFKQYQAVEKIIFFSDLFMS